jgi:hypothetical protein
MKHLFNNLACNSFNTTKNFEFHHSAPSDQNICILVGSPNIEIYVSDEA